LARAILKHYNIKPELIKGHNQIFEVLLQGQVIYNNQSICGRFPVQENLFEEMEKYLPPLS